MFIEYVNIPEPPEELLETDLNVIKTFEMLSPKEAIDMDIFWSAVPPNLEQLKEYYKEYLDFRNIVYQYVGKNIFIHSDSEWGGGDYAYNYIIESGGDEVYTEWYNDSLTHREIIEPRRWHKLDVRTKHTVSNLMGPRFALRIVV